MKGALRLVGILSVFGVLLIVTSNPVTVRTPRVDAHRLHPGLDFSLAVAGAPSCNTLASDATCALTPGSEFTVNVNLGPLPSDIPSYGGFDIRITFQGVASKGAPSTAAWPDCVYPAFYEDSPGDFFFACTIGVAAIGPAPNSTYTGTIATILFTCTQAGTIVLHNRTVGDVNETDLVEDLAAIHTDPTPTETLRITCGTALVRSGDANCDGLVNSLDALLILQWSAHLLDRLPCPDDADANADGVVNAVDASLVLQASAGLLQMPPPPPTATITPTPTATPTPTRCLIVGPGGTSTCCPGPCLVTPTATPCLLVGPGGPPTSCCPGPIALCTTTPTNTPVPIAHETPQPPDAMAR